MAETPKDDTPQSEKPPKKKFCGVKGKSGAPKGNTNNAHHYMRAGKLPAKLMYIEHRINGFRRHLEDELIKNKGEVNIVDAAAINSACKWERHGLLAQHWLRHQAEKLNADQLLKFSEAIAKASDNRDKNLRLLGLDAPPQEQDLKAYIVETKKKQ